MKALTGPSSSRSALVRIPAARSTRRETGPRPRRDSWRARERRLTRVTRARWSVLLFGLVGTLSPTLPLLRLVRHTVPTTQEAALPIRQSRTYRHATAARPAFSRRAPTRQHSGRCESAAVLW